MERKIRNDSTKMINVYFLILFACCRESYIAGSKTGDASWETDFTGLTRGKACMSSAKPANFTLLFGCNPAEGVAADTKFVSCFIKHIENHFDPEDGTVILPETFSVVDSAKEAVKFESTSCNLGR